MKKCTFVLIGLIALAAFVLYAKDSLWHENFERAKAEAKDSGKPMLLNFSGSDWCIWCKKLNNEVLSKSEFQEYARENLVLVDVDFPQFRSQNDTLKKQNQELAQTFKVQGFPTVVLLSSEGREIGRTGYQRGGPEKYVEHLKSILQANESEESE
jgi:protein disulfide-isomerase